MQNMTLCGRCVERMRERHIVKKISQPINNKVTCDCCKLRRYGGEYAVTLKRRDDRE